MAYIKLTLDDADAAASLENVGKDMLSMAGRLTMVALKVGAAGGAIMAPFILGTKQMIQFGSALDFASRRLGVSAQAMSKLQVVGAVFGVTLETMEIGMKTIGERLVQMKMGAAGTMQAFKMANVNLQAFMSSGDTADRFFMIAEGLAKIEDHGRRAGLALQLLGEAGTQLLPFLGAGSEKLKELGDSLKRFGIRKEVVDNSRDLRLEWTMFGFALRNVSMELANTVAPALTVVLNLVAKFLTSVREFIITFPVVQRLMAAVGVTLIGLAGALSVLAGILAGGAGIVLFIVAVGALTRAFAALSMAVVYTGVTLGMLTGVIAIFTAGVFWLTSTNSGLWVFDVIWQSIASSIGLAVVALAKFIQLLTFGMFGGGMEAFGKSMIGNFMTFEDFKKAREDMLYGDKMRGFKPVAMEGGIGDFTQAGMFGGSAAGGRSFTFAGIGGSVEDQMLDQLEEINQNTKQANRDYKDFKVETMEQAKFVL